MPPWFSEKFHLAALLNPKSVGRIRLSVQISHRSSDAGIVNRIVNEVSQMRRVWIDCDPGHDDAFALVLALFSPGIEVIGVSTTAGNQTLEKTTLNARRMLAALKQTGKVRVVKGAARPLLAEPRACPEIHGGTGLDLPPGPAYDALRARFVALVDTCNDGEAEENGLLTMRATLLREAEGGADVVATGCLTNVALLISAFPEVRSRIRRRATLLPPPSSTSW